MNKITLIVLTAGEGSRMRPLTTNCSKAMIRVNGKPVIDYIISQFLRDNLGQVIVVEGKHKDTSEYMAKRYPDLSKKTSVTQPIPKGPRDALEIGLMAVTDPFSPVVVWFGDTILFDKLPYGTDFFASNYVTDQSEWVVWDGESMWSKPTEEVPGGRAVVGVFSFASQEKLRKSVAAAKTYDLEEVVLHYGLRDTVVSDWFDIGVPSRYHYACAHLLNMKTRAFNAFSYNADLNVLTKRARGDARAALTLEAESAWYAGLSPAQSLFVPRRVSSNNDVLVLTYEPGVLLSDLAMHEDLTPSTWRYVLRKLMKTVTNYLHAPAPSRNFAEDFSKHSNMMWVDGIRDRLSEVQKAGILDVGTITELRSYAYVAGRASKPVGCMHGDLHLGNVLYDAQLGKLTLIDPRGRYGTYVGAHGGDVYDWCKLAYDCVHGFSALVYDQPISPVVREAFLDVAREFNIDLDVALDGGIVLLATGIPLHYDDPRRQERFAHAVNEYVTERKRHAA